MEVVTAGKLSQVINNSPDYLKAFASFATTDRQYGLFFPQILIFFGFMTGFSAIIFLSPVPVNIPIAFLTHSPKVVT
jgi:hypothetical protein